MENPKKPNFYENDDENKQCIYGSGEAGDLRFLHDLWPSSANLSIHGAGTGTQPFTQQQLGQAADISTADSSIAGGEPDRLSRKREYDRAYRYRCKENKERMSCDLGTLGEENKHLIHENESLTMDNAVLNQMVQTQSEELNQLSIKVKNLKLKKQKQSVLVQALTDLLVCSPDLRSEYQQLVTENLALRQNWTMNPHMLQLVEEIAKLRVENRVLKERKEALCVKIVSDRDNNQANHPSW